jgi:hypothetical protein
MKPSIQLGCSALKAMFRGNSSGMESVSVKTLFYSYCPTVQTWITYWYYLMFVTAVFTNMEIPGYINSVIKKLKKTPWSESASELCRQSERRLSAKWLPTFADRECYVVSVTDPYGRILGFLDRSRYFSIKYLLSCTLEAERTPFQTHCFFFW